MNSPEVAFPENLQKNTFPENWQKKTAKFLRICGAERLALCSPG
jgi:hypothetical protein